jgi:hypothetical protein
MMNDRQAFGELLRGLFEMLREVMPATPEYTRRQSEFAAHLQDLRAAGEHEGN